MSRAWAATLTACLLLLLTTTAVARGVTVCQSVEQALDYSPLIEASAQNHQAVEYDLEQATGGYLPSIDLLLGYGLEQHSDSVTRLEDADPNDIDWYKRGEASLQFRQLVYDGGETGQKVSVQKSLLDSSRYRLQGVSQDVALFAIEAHLDIFRQRELVALAEKNLQLRREIHQYLIEWEQSGAGNIADVTQTQARLARAQSTLHLTKANLNGAIAHYARVIGLSPDPELLSFVKLPGNMPPNEEQTLGMVEKSNPELLILSAELAEAEERVALARAAYKPKIDLQLSGSYNDHLEGIPSWSNTNLAMMNLSWNLFRGGQDKAIENSNKSRALQKHSTRGDKLIELRAQVTTEWATYDSLQSQKAALKEAVDYSRKTFDYYLKQFTYSQRSLLDVLIVENEYFLTASQLINVIVKETLTAYRIMALTGQLEMGDCSNDREYPEEIQKLSRDLVFGPSGSDAISMTGEVAMTTVSQPITATVKREKENPVSEPHKEIRKNRPASTDR